MCVSDTAYDSDFVVGQGQHAGIVRLYGYGEQDGILFYSMELVDGTSLEEEIAAGRKYGDFTAQERMGP